jgi:hypothetical protein
VCAAEIHGVLGGTVDTPCHGWHQEKLVEKTLDAATVKVAFALAGSAALGAVMSGGSSATLSPSRTSTDWPTASTQGGLSMSSAPVASVVGYEAPATTSSAPAAFEYDTDSDAQLLPNGSATYVASALSASHSSRGRGPTPTPSSRRVPAPGSVERLVSVRPVASVGWS